MKPALKYFYVVCIIDVGQNLQTFFPVCWDISVAEYLSAVGTFRFVTAVRIRIGIVNYIPQILYSGRT
jgi:hypothetical protein